MFSRFLHLRRRAGKGREGGVSEVDLPAQVSLEAPPGGKDHLKGDRPRGNARWYSQERVPIEEGGGVRGAGGRQQVTGQMGILDGDETWKRPLETPECLLPSPLPPVSMR